MKEIAILLSLFLLFFSFGLGYADEENNVLKVIFMDIGVIGDSAIIQLPNEKTIMIDGGNPGSYDVIKNTLIKNKITTIDTVIATHPDKDHIAGLTDLLNDKTIEINQVLTIDFPRTTSDYIDFTKAMKSRGITPENVTAGYVVDLDKRVRIKILSPPENTDLPFNKKSDQNANSIVTKLRYENIKFLFTGDSTFSTEDWLMDNYQNYTLNIDIMDALHHGSVRTSNSEKFIKALSPELVIFSANLENKRHPSEEIVERYQFYEAKTLQTGVVGNIVILTDGVRCSIILEKMGEMACYEDTQPMSQTSLVLPFKNFDEKYISTLNERMNLMSNQSGEQFALSEDLDNLRLQTSVLIAIIIALSVLSVTLTVQNRSKKK